MTTAQRTTFKPAIGGSEQGGYKTTIPSRQYSAKDMPAHRVLKFRKEGQGREEEVENIDFLQELRAKEQILSQKKEREYDQSEIAEMLGIKTNENALKAENVFVQDKDDEFSEDDEENEEMDEIFREMEEIKKQRERERLKEEEELKIKQKLEKQEEILNMMRNGQQSTLKRKWYEETVFRNQSKTDTKKKKRFINDTVRSDFHRSFMARTIL